MFHTPELWRRGSNGISPNPGACALPDNHPKLRSTERANQAVELPFHARHMLVAMATGTGKTFTTVKSDLPVDGDGSAKRFFLESRDGAV